MSECDDERLAGAQQTQHSLFVRRAYEGRADQRCLATLAALAHQVRCERLETLNFSATCQLETLFGTRMGFHFRHCK